MANKSPPPEQVINKLRQAEVAISAGSTVSEASRQIGVTEQTYYRWRNEYGGLRIDQVKRLNRAVAGLILDNQILTDDIVELSSRSGRYGHCRIAALLRHRGWNVNHKGVERIWRREGLKVPSKQPRGARLWLNDVSCVRLRPNRPNHVRAVTTSS